MTMMMMMMMMMMIMMLACRSSGNPGSWGRLQPRDEAVELLSRKVELPSVEEELLELLQSVNNVMLLLISLSDHSLISKMFHSSSKLAAVKN